MFHMKHFIITLIVWNLIAFIIMGIDKLQAKRQGQRVSEKLLIIVSFLCGAIGISAGALIFHHKTRKRKFRIFLPLALVANILFIRVLIKGSTIFS